MFRYRAKIIAVNENEGTVRYKLLECIDDSGSGRDFVVDILGNKCGVSFSKLIFIFLIFPSDSDEQYDSEEDPLDSGFLDRIEPV